MRVVHQIFQECEIGVAKHGPFVRLIIKEIGGEQNPNPTQLEIEGDPALLADVLENAALIIANMNLLTDTH